MRSHKTLAWVLFALLIAGVSIVISYRMGEAEGLHESVSAMPKFGALELSDQQSMSMQSISGAASRAPQDYPKASPFVGVMWDDSTPEVIVASVPGAGGVVGFNPLISVDGVSTDQIILMCKRLDIVGWRKRFDEDFMEVMMRNGHNLGTSTTVVVQQTGNNSLVTLNAQVNYANYIGVLNVEKSQDEMEAKNAQ